MKLQDVPKLRVGDLIRCGPNRCGCSGKVYSVYIDHGICGCVLYYHTHNPNPFVIDSRECCSESGHHTLHWATGFQEGSKMSVARRLQPVLEKKMAELELKLLDD